MKKLVLAVMAVVLTACTSVPNYRSLANQVVPTNVELVAEITDFFSGVKTVKAYCSGVAVSPTHIITAGHCTKAAQEAEGELRKFLKDGKIMVRLQDGTVVLARIVAETFAEDEDPAKSHDSALLITDEPVLTAVAVIGNSDDLAVGDQVAIVGNSFGQLKHSFTVGVVSYVNRELPGAGVFIQTDALSAPGNSGGPVFDMNGKLIGILVRGGGGISLLVPINLVMKDLMDKVHGK